VCRAWTARSWAASVGQVTHTRDDESDSAASRLVVPYARRIRGEPRVTVAVRVREATASDLGGMIEAEHVPEITVSQLVRRYIAEGLARDKAKAAGDT
jgi:hypothetical protein